MRWWLASLQVRFVSDVLGIPGCVASTFMLTGLYMYMNMGRVILKIDSEEAERTVKVRKFP